MWLNEVNAGPELKAGDSRVQGEVIPALIDEVSVATDRPALPHALTLLVSHSRRDCFRRRQCELKTPTTLTSQTNFPYRR